MMKSQALLMLASAALLTGCVDYEGVIGGGQSSDKSTDRGIDSKHLSQLQAGIWVDPNGCDHWIIDDGVEGYLSARLDRRGKPVCSGIALPTQTAGDFKAGSPYPDPN